MKYLVLAVIINILASTAASADVACPESEPGLGRRWGVGRGQAKAPVGYPSIPVHGCMYEGEVVEGWDGVQADPLFDKLDVQMDRLYAQRHGGKKLGGGDEGHTATVRFTIVRKTKQITAIKVDETVSTDPAFSAETVNMLRNVRLPKTWSARGPAVIDVCYTIYSGKPDTGSAADDKQSAADQGEGVVSARLVRVKTAGR